MLRWKNDIWEQERMIKHYIKSCHLGNTGERHIGINSLYYFCNFTAILKLFQNKDFFKKKKKLQPYTPYQNLSTKGSYNIKRLFYKYLQVQTDINT